MFNFSWLRNLTNFGWLAQISTGRKPWMSGLLPQIQTLMALLLISAAIASGLWLWTGAAATLAVFLPLYLKTAIGVIGMTFLNFWFNREINTFMLGTREARDNFKFDDHNPIELRKLVNHIRHEVNAHFRKIYGAKHQDIPMPRLLTFTDHHFKIVTVPGRNPGKAALCFSSGALSSHDTHLNQRHLAALIQMEMVKIYQRRGVTGTLVAMGMDLLSTIENARSGNWFYRILGILAGPLQFFLLVQRAVSRSYEYDAALTVPKLGRGMDLIDAIDFKVCPVLFEKPTFLRLTEAQARKRREPYNGFMSTLLRPITDWIDSYEYEGDDKTGYRFISMIDIIVRELGFLINEWFDPKPRSTNLKVPLRKDIVGYEQAKDNKDLDNLRKKDIILNRKLYSQIPKVERYEVIGPNGDGYAEPARTHGHNHDLHEQLEALQNTVDALSRGRRSTRVTMSPTLITKHRHQARVTALPEAPSTRVQHRHRH